MNCVLFPNCSYENKFLQRTLDSAEHTPESSGKTRRYSGARAGTLGNIKQKKYGKYKIIKYKIIKYKIIENRS